MNHDSSSQGPAFFSYGFRPFFFSASLFAGIAVPLWILLLSGSTDIELFYAARDWHVHEMVFGFVPCIIAGFVFTAIPNWSDRPPICGWTLMLLLATWVCGRMAMANASIAPVLAAIIDGSFLVVVAGIVWREIMLSQIWDRSPIGILITFYALANLTFHALSVHNEEADPAYRMGLAILLVLLALIGGRVTPGFTEDFMAERQYSKQPSTFSRYDGFSILLLGITASFWVLAPRSTATGMLFLVAGLIHMVRLLRWYGWMTWREPLVLVLHVGYGWLVISLFLLGSSILGVWLNPEDAIHALTTGAVGVMTLAIMTRASLGHTGRVKHADPLTVTMYLLINLGAALRVFGPSVHLPGHLILEIAGASWSGAYLLFAVAYGYILFSPSVDEQE
ncbi:MAG: NnrS family protein [Nitrospirales bacterium]|nr:NnrS family protein [Nitrospira sp.]MDR4501143.1 NnrS family protein [Nitrospirales bacterium]